MLEWNLAGTAARFTLRSYRLVLFIRQQRAASTERVRGQFGSHNRPLFELRASNMITVVNHNHNWNIFIYTHKYSHLSSTREKWSMLTIITSLQWIHSSLCETTIFFMYQVFVHLCHKKFRIFTVVSAGKVSPSWFTVKENTAGKFQTSALRIQQCRSVFSEVWFTNENKECNRNTLVFSFMLKLWQLHQTFSLTVALCWMSSLCWSPGPAECRSFRH